MTDIRDRKNALKVFKPWMIEAYRNWINEGNSMTCFPQCNPISKINAKDWGDMIKTVPELKAIADAYKKRKNDEKRLICLTPINFFEKKPREQ